MSRATALTFAAAVLLGAQIQAFLLTPPPQRSADGTHRRAEGVRVAALFGRSSNAEKVVEASPAKELKSYTYDSSSPKIVWDAARNGTRFVEEGKRPLMDYLALPPSQYSILDPKMIERTGDETFTCKPGELNFFGTAVAPVLYIRVNVDAAAATANISIESVELEGSEAVRSIRGAYNVSCSNVVSFTTEPRRQRSRLAALLGRGTDRGGEDDEEDDAVASSGGRGDAAAPEPAKGVTGGGRTVKAITSTVTLRVDLLVPRESWLPPTALEKGGSFVLQRVLDIGVPQFLRFLRRDYERWSAGDDSRAPVA